MMTLFLIGLALWLIVSLHTSRDVSFSVSARDAASLLLQTSDKGNQEIPLRSVV